jgi:hypothetical protein
MVQESNFVNFDNFAASCSGPHPSPLVPETFSVWSIWADLAVQILKKRFRHVEAGFGRPLLKDAEPFEALMARCSDIAARANEAAA